MNMLSRIWKTGAEASLQSWTSELIDALRRHAREQGNAVAFRYLKDGEREETICTYRELEAKVRAKALWLCAESLSGKRVLLCYPNTPEFVVTMLACLWAGVIAVPVNVPRRSRGTRLRTIAVDAQVSAILTTQEVPESCHLELEQLADDLVVMMLISENAENVQSNVPLPALSPNAIAYLQYTSGSTCDPKGVMVSHRNIAANCASLTDVVGQGPHVVVSWLPFYHDMGLVGTIFFPIWCGYSLVFMPPSAFLMKPVRWLQAITRYRGTLSPAPNFAYDLCTRRVSSEQRSQLDLSSWRIAFNGAERIGHDTLQRFSAAFRDSGFRTETFFPCYGLAESTLVVTGGAASEKATVRQFDPESIFEGQAKLSEKGASYVGCGRPVGKAVVVIADPVTSRSRPEGGVGEIWTVGPSVANGYWNNAVATMDSFEACLAGSEERRFLRTGDIGFFWHDELFIVGRIKDLIIIAGRNIAAEDIELVVEDAHDAIHPGGVIAFADNDNASKEKIVVVAEIPRHFGGGAGLKGIETAIREAVANHHDAATGEVVLVPRGMLLRTANGKKARSECRRAWKQGELKGLGDD